MARSTIPGSVHTRRVVALRPEARELEAIEAYAAQWRCGLGEAALRLVRAGLAAPETAAPSERVKRVQQLLPELGPDGVIAWCSREWGLTHGQSRALITEAEAC